MELLKKNIHMDRAGAEAVSQITLEEDVNIPDQKPDAEKIVFRKGTVVIDEVKPGTEQVSVRGRLLYTMLYETKEEGCGLERFSGRASFEEKLHMEGITPQSQVYVRGLVEDLSISLIHSRKLTLQAVVTLQAFMEEIYDEEVPIGIAGEEKAEFRKIPLELARLSVDKRDTLRQKEELSLPSGYPNVFQVLWDEVAFGDMEFRMEEEKINIRGEIRVFILYEGEGESHPLRTYETTVPFEGSLECHGAKEGMIPQIAWNLSPQEHGQPYVTIKPDQDGEERILSLDLLLELSIKLYEEEETEAITDLYGVTTEIKTKPQETQLKQVLARVSGKTRVTDTVKVGGGSSILQLLHAQGELEHEEPQLTDNGILLQGNIFLQILYITGDDEEPFASAEVRIPYQYTLEIAGIRENGEPGKIHGELEKLQTVMLDGEEMDVKAVLVFSTTVFKKLKVELVGEVEVGEPDMDKRNALPGIAIYLVKPGDNLWNIGRRFYLPVDTIRQENHLEKDELAPGQKILLVKGDENGTE